MIARSVRRYQFLFSFLLAGFAHCAHGAERFHLVTIDPAHFHAALVQKEMYAQVSPRAAVYAPLGADLLEHLKRIVLFNTRKDNPTAWELDIHTGAGFEKQALANPRQGIVILSGRNSKKMERISAAVKAGYHVLGDKPWTLSSADIPRLSDVLDAAERQGRVAFDIMTERYEITSMVAREVVADPAVFGTPVPGTPEEPGVFMESIHHIMKEVAGVASLRPLSFFDIEEQGEGLSDVGTHLVDLAQWTLFPGQPIDYRTQIEMVAGKRWPTVLSPADFRRVTGVAEAPEGLRRQVTPEGFAYYCNNLVSYRLRGVYVKLNVLWNYEAPPGGGDVYEAVFRGTRARVEIRQGKKENYRPELYIVPARSDDRAAVAKALDARIAAVARRYAGIQVEEKGAEFHVSIPARHRTSHEAHFAEVTREFFSYLASPKSIPAWEKPNMLAKYWVTTRGVEMSRMGAK